MYKLKRRSGLLSRNCRISRLSRLTPFQSLRDSSFVSRTLSTSDYIFSSIWIMESWAARLLPFQADVWLWKASDFSCVYTWDPWWGARYAGHDNCLQEFKTFISRFCNVHRSDINDCQTVSTSHEMLLLGRRDHWRRRSLPTFTVIPESSANTSSMYKIYHASRILDHRSALRGPPTLFPYGQIYR